MNKNAWVLMGVFAITAMLGAGSANAGEARGDSDNIPSHGQDRGTGPRPARGCQEVGSGISECEFDWMCWEDEGLQMSICEKRRFNLPEAHDP